MSSRPRSPRIAPLPRSAWDDQVRTQLERVPGGLEQPFHIFTTFARHPELMRRWLPPPVCGPAFGSCSGGDAWASASDTVNTSAGGTAIVHPRRKGVLQRRWIAGSSVQPGDIADTCSETYPTLHHCVDSATRGPIHAVARGIDYGPAA